MSMVTSAVLSSYVLQVWFFSLLAFVNSRGSFLEVFDGESIYLTFLQVHCFCSGAHKYRLNAGWKLAMLAGEEGTAET